MGSYTNLTIDGHPILESKSFVYPEVMTMFQEFDKRIEIGKASERHELVGGKIEPEDDEREEVFVTYSCEVAKVIDRLDVMGFTMQRARNEFEALRKSEVEKLTAWSGDGEGTWHLKDLDYFTNVTFDRYSEALSKVLAQRLRSHSVIQTTELGPIEQRIVSETEDHIFGFLCSDVRSFIRLVCELVPEHSEVVQDISEVVSAGYYDEDETVCANSTRGLIAGHPENSARIVLTEGSTDAEILSKALQLLYPHLVGYYTFLDFSALRVQGGAGNLVTIVKSFAAAGISNRIIAIFDNDTAAFDARRSLDSVQLPPNIVVCNYPDLLSLETYPTIGPSGLGLLNVNGLAASIELYLGSDILENGEGFPVQWKGYMESLKKYQGEVMYKTRLQEKFREKVARCELSEDEFFRCDWSGLSAILEVIFHAFD